MENRPTMFCYQCQETARGKGCELQGVCGKHADTSARMDLLLYAVRGIAIINSALREKGEPDRDASHFVIDALFTTITNANFDNDSLDGFIRRAFELKNILAGTAKKRGIELPDLPQVEFFATPDEADKCESFTGVLAEPNEDIRGLKQLAIYGCKGMSAYARHAANLGYEEEDVYAIIENAMAETARPDMSVEELLSLVLEVGDGGVKVMDLLDRANTSTYGNPEVTKVDIGVRDRPGILISGHDLKDLEELLEQTKDRGVDVYTHSEMLPGHYYPFFKKYPHFAGNYGNAWWKQTTEFEKFNGVFLFTTNCIVPPRGNCTYMDRVYTTGVVGMPGTHHIPDGHPKDFSKLIEHAQKWDVPNIVTSNSLSETSRAYHECLMPDNATTHIRSCASPLH
jgi:hydroxylamine reductase